MRNPINILIILISLLVTVTGYAVTVNGLYRAEIPVTAQSNPSKAQSASVMKQALKQVFIKVSGDSSVANLGAVQEALTHVDRYLQSYSYFHKPLPNGESGYFLQAQFSSSAIKQLLLTQNQTLWGKNRPLVLVWIAMQKQAEPKGNVALISGDSESGKNITGDAKLRGLPTIFPLFDLTDMQTISTKDIINPNANSETIRQASKRYGCDAVLTCSIKQEADGQWSAHWALISRGNQTQWDNSAATQAELISSGIDTVTDTLAARYGVPALQENQEQNHLQLTVVNIENLSHYAKVTDYLQSLTPVKQVDVAQIGPSSIVYDLNVLGGRFALLQALSLDHRLKPVGAVDNMSDMKKNNNNNIDNNFNTNTTTNNSDNMDKGLVYRWIS